MLTKRTAKNQITLPKALVEATGTSDYYDVSVEGGCIVLTPVCVQRADAVRDRLAELGLGDADIDDAVAWAREVE